MDCFVCDVMLFLISCGLFFFKQKTAYEVRISDWSSDVCSSDLINPLFSAFFQPFDAPFEDGVDQSILAAEVIGDHHFVGLTCRGTDLGEGNASIASAGEEPLGSDHQQIGRAPCRERVCQYV